MAGWLPLNGNYKGIMRDAVKGNMRRLNCTATNDPLKQHVRAAAFTLNATLFVAKAG